MIQTFKTKQEMDSYLAGGAKSGNLYISEDSEEIVFITNNIKGETKTYQMVNLIPYLEGTVEGVITIPEGTTKIKDAMFLKSSITGIVLPSTLKAIGNSCFLSCSKLTSVDIPDSVTSIGESAFNSSGLANIKLSGNLTNISPMLFAYCNNLTSVDIPDSVTVIDRMAFLSCTNLSVINFGNTRTAVPALNNINAFQNSLTTRKIIVPDALYDTWINTANWNSTTNNIKDSIIRYSEAVSEGIITAKN